jgi:hypothetical protein
MKKAIKLTKLEQADNPLYKAGLPEAYQYGGLNENVSVPKGYTLEGYCEELPKVGSPFAVERYIRNDVRAYGTFLSSTVTKVTENGFETLNSKYTLEFTDKVF